MSQSERRRSSHRSEKERMSRTSSRRSHRDSERDSERDNRQSSRASYGGSISDVEREDRYDSNNKYRHLAKKLSKDKSKLKDKLRRLLDKVDHRTEEHRDELEKTQEYFQEQIAELANERDRALVEKEFILRKFDEKLNKYRNILEKKYEIKNSQVVKRLETAIATLQKRLSEQIDEREHVKETAEQYYSQRDEQHRRNIADLEDQLLKTRELHAKERKELQMLTKTFTDEKEQIILRMNKEYDEELKKVLTEKNTTIIALQGVKDNMERRAKFAEKERDNQITNAKMECEQVKIEYERKVAQLNKTYNQRFAEMKERHEGQLTESNRVNYQNLELQKEEYERKLENIEYTHKRDMEQHDNDKKKEIHTLQDIINNLKKENTKLKVNFNENVLQRVSQVNVQHDKIVNKIKIEMGATIQKKNDELEAMKERTDRIQTEMKNEHDKLKSRLADISTEIQQTKQNSDNMNTQFIKRLNEQKLRSDGIIAEKEMKIYEVTRQMKKLSEETVDQFNFLDRKLKLAKQELEEMTAKFHKVKADLNDAENNSSIYKKEVIRLSQINSQFDVKLKSLQGEISGYERKLKQSEVEINRSESLSAKFKGDSSRLAQVEVQFRQSQIKYQEELEKLRAQLKEKEDIVEKYNNNFRNNGERSTRLQQMVCELQEKKRQMEAEIEVKGKEIAHLEQELEISRRDANDNLVRLNQVKNQLSTDVRAQVKSMQELKDHEIKSLNNEVTKLQEKVSITEKSKDALATSLNALTTERDKLKKDLIKYEQSQTDVNCLTEENDSLKQQIARIKIQIQESERTNNARVEGLQDELNKAHEKIRKHAAKEGEINNLQTEIDRLKDNFASTMNKVTKQNQREKGELENLRRNAKNLIDNKTRVEQQNIQLTNQLNTIQQNYRNMIDKIQNDSTIERNRVHELTKQLAELQETEQRARGLEQLVNKLRKEYRNEFEKNESMYKNKVVKLQREVDNLNRQINQNDQRLENAKLDYLKKLNEAKLLPPEDQQKMIDLGRERDEMKIQLDAAEKKLEKLQFEFASVSAIIKTKTQIIQQREADLRKLEQNLRNTPPKILDPMFKKQRDEALSHLRSSKLEINKLKEEVLELTQKLGVAESLVKDIEKQKNITVKSQTDLKKTFVENLNQQQARHEKEMERREARIRELEQMITGKGK